MNMNDDLISLARETRATAAELKVDAVLTLLRSADILKRCVVLNSRKYGLSLAAWAVLFVLVVRGGKLTPTEISQRTLRAKYTITEIVDTLEAGGLVTRTLDPDDRRKKYVEITQKGLEIVSVGHAERTEFSDNILAPLTSSEIRQLVKLLKRLNKYLITQNDLLNSNAGEPLPT